MKEGRRERREGGEKKKEEEVNVKEKMKEKIIFYHDDGPSQLFVSQYLIDMNIAPMNIAPKNPGSAVTKQPTSDNGGSDDAVHQIGFPPRLHLIYHI